MNVLLGVAEKLLPASGGAEIVCLALEIGPMPGGIWIDIHAANRIFLSRLRSGSRRDRLMAMRLRISAARMRVRRVTFFLGHDAVPC